MEKENASLTRKIYTAKLGKELHSDSRKSQTITQKRLRVGQKIVIKVQLTSQNCRTKALKTAAEAKGVSNVSIDVEKAVVEVIGIGVDAVSLAQSLEKQLGFASIVSVGEVKKPEEPKPAIPIEWTSSYIHCPRKLCAPQKAPFDP
ncbi:hypothetical protein Prudu_015589 [Prunus dulcis]|uniref:HMA domain-containing protein n=1 Tax=Prunus dulcis TaxID=3755 RepID=A0A4Y1RJN4_PRUDU|nr:hypothetical protein Prudu_015589 [Prunus dulcis]